VTIRDPGSKNKVSLSKSGNSQVFPAALPIGFHPGAMILATLNNPREKFWGSILALDPAGLSMAGLELSSVDDCTNMVISGEEFAPATLFFPMHRVERIELDAPQGDIPSLSQRFLARTGQEATSVFSRTPASAIGGDADS